MVRTDFALLVNSTLRILPATTRSRFRNIIPIHKFKRLSWSLTINERFSSCGYQLNDVMMQHVRETPGLSDPKWNESKSPTATITCEQKSSMEQSAATVTGLSRRARKRINRERLKKIGDPQKAKRAKLDDETPDHNIVTQDAMNETSYYFEDGLRKVYPYYFTFSTHAKGRWCGQTVLDIFRKEFGSLDPEYHKIALDCGRVKVNGVTVTADHKFKTHDFITNHVHRHENAVTDEPIKILENTEHVVVVNKPSSIPVHPCGRYRHNSLMFILSKEYNMNNLRPMYRLDRLTSGLLILCKSEEFTTKMQQEIKSRQVHKEYICRVGGEFPEEEVEVNEPLSVLCHKIGIFSVTPNGKEAKTKFKRLSYNGKTSVVKCYPIVNDLLYNHPVWGPSVGAGGDFGKSEAQLVEDLLAVHNPAQFIVSDDNHLDGISPRENNISNDPKQDREHHPKNEEQSHNSQSDLQSFNQTGVASEDNVVSKPQSLSVEAADGTSRVGLSEVNVDENKDIVSSEVKCGELSRQSDKHIFDKRKATFDEHCYYCTRKFRPPTRDELVMYLHAYRYKGESWDFSAPLPPWAAEDWIDE